MPDILKVTTPLVNKNQPVQPKAGVEPTAAFDIQNPARVIQPHNQSELMGQNNGLLQSGDAPQALIDLLKDPAVAASYLKNIFLLEEIYKLLPANNHTVTPEIEQLFDAMLLPPEELAPEMARQEQASTRFKGAIFDFLRQLTDSGPPEVQNAAAGLLRCMNNLLCKEDILDAVANNLGFLRGELASSAKLSAALDELIAAFRAPGAGGDFGALKQRTLQLLKDVEESILYTPKLSKVLSIAIYNLSRFHSGADALNEAAFLLRQYLEPAQRQQLASLLQGFLQQTQGAPAQEQEPPRVMEALIRLIGDQAGRADRSVGDEGKLEKILHSLLSSPCNFTPLLHFILPAALQDVRAFAEIWINPRSDERDMPPGMGPGIHILLVIDAEGAGRFEAELFVHGRTVDVALYCPPGSETRFGGLHSGLAQATAGLAYRLGQVQLHPLEKPRSLMDVFKSLPYKRVGVDVRI